MGARNPKGVYSSSIEAYNQKEVFGASIGAWNSKEGSMQPSITLPSLYRFIEDVSIRLGCSIIPLSGKRPSQGFAYTKYQRQGTTQADLQRWFSGSDYASYGILCGPASQGLLVLDFDSDSAYTDFAALFSHLPPTYTVKTRRGYHVYLRTTAAVSTRKIPGGDLLARGSLVVGAGSIVNEHCYTVAVDTAIHKLTDSEYAALQQWMKSSDISGSHPTAANTQSQDMARLITSYQTSAKIQGRNNALYRTSLAAARRGIDQSKAQNALIPLHVIMPANGPHAPESARERQQEAQDTIASAYRRTQTHTARIERVTTGAGLPNGIRETLLQQQNSTITARLLDALLLEGWQKDRRFTTSEAVETAAAYGIGRSSVLDVLSRRLSIMNGLRLFERSTTSSDSHNNKTPVREGDNRRFNSPNKTFVLRGRAVNVYRFPSLDHVQRVCGVADANIGSYDALSADDLRTERTYRLALHRALIARAQPELSYQWHAARLNVSHRSIFRYNASLGVVVTPVIAYEPLTWAMLNQPQNWPAVQKNAQSRTLTPGSWLQAEGQRYPAIRGLAAHLLAHKPTAVLCRQQPSRFALTPRTHECIWRRLDGTAADWYGGLHDDPMQQKSFSLIANNKSQTIEEPSPSYDALLQAIHAQNLRPDDLTAIKGIGSWRAERLNAVGITQYRQLAQADPARLVGLSQMGEGMSARLVAFWMAQAQALISRQVAPHDLKGWSFADWKVCQMEAARIGAARHGLKAKLAAEFRDKGWLKYQPELPRDFLQLIENLLI